MARKPPAPTIYPGTFNLGEIPDRARFRDALGHTYTRRGDLAIGQCAGEEYRTPITSLWRPLDVIPTR